MSISQFEYYDVGTSLGRSGRMRTTTARFTSGEVAQQFADSETRVPGTMNKLDVQKVTLSISDASTLEEAEADLAADELDRRILKALSKLTPADIELLGL